MSKYKFVLVLTAVVLSIFFYCIWIKDVEIIEVKDDLIIVRSSKNYGVLNIEGDDLHRIKYDYYKIIGDYLILGKSEDIFIINRESPKKIINTYEEIILKDEFEDYLIYYSEKSKQDILIGDKIIELDNTYDAYKESYYSYYYFKDKLFHHQYAITIKNDKWGFIDDDGVEILEPTYYYLSGYSDEGESIACVTKLDCGLINTEGEVIDQLIHLRDKYDNDILEKPVIKKTTNLIINQVGNFFGVINKDDEVLIPYEFDEIKHYQNELTRDINSYPKDTEFFLVQKNEKWGIYNYNGDKILDAVHDGIYQIQFNYIDENKAFIIAIKDDHKGIYTINGERLTEFIYDDIKSSSNLQFIKHPNIYYLVMRDDKWGYLNQNGDEITDIIYDDAYLNCEKLLVKNDKISYIVDYQSRYKDYGYCYYDLEGEVRFLTKENEVVYRDQKSIYFIDEDGNQTRIHNHYFNLSMNNILTGFAAIIASLIIHFLIIYIIKMFKKKKENLQELRGRLDL